MPTPTQIANAAAERAAKAPHTLTDAEAAAIAEAAGSLETLGDVLKREGRSNSAELAYGHADRLSAIYTRWAFGRGADAEFSRKAVA